MLNIKNLFVSAAIALAVMFASEALIATLGASDINFSAGGTPNIVSAGLKAWQRQMFPPERQSPPRAAKSVTGRASQYSCNLVPQASSPT